MQPTLDFIPLVVFILLTVGIVILSIEAGFWIGKRQSLKADFSKDAVVNAIVGAMLGLLAFMLAFTFGFAAARFETRRNLVLEESNALGTTYLRAGYLTEPNRTEIKRLLKDYIDLRVAAPHTQIEDVLARTDLLQNQLWTQAVSVAEKNPNSITLGLFIQSLNEVIDIHSKRVMAALWSRIPIVIWYALFFLTALSMASVGYLSGLSGKRNPVIFLIAILGFASVIYLISDLDRPQEGILRVPQQSMIDLQKKISS